MAVRSSLVDEMLSEEYEFEIPTSMIDVVFLLLIFFLVASKFKRPENKLDTELPAYGGQNTGPPPLPPREYRVYVDGTDSSKPIFMLDRTPVKDLSELIFKLKNIAQSSPQLSIVIVGKHKTPFVYIVWVLDACKEAKIDDVRFQGLPVEGLGRPAGNG